MNLRAQLTLWSVLVMAVIVGAVTAVDLAQEVKLQFESALERADYTMGVAVNEVKQTVNRNPTIAIPDALQSDRDLANELLAAMSTSKSLYEIAVCDPQGVILVDSVPTPPGTRFPDLPDFEPLVHKGSLIDKMRVILLAGAQKYQRSQGLGVPNQPIAIYVRIVVWPALMTQKEIIPIIQRHAQVSILLLMGSIVVAFLFSAVAFRPIDKLGHMLDLLMRGEFESQETLPPAKPADEFGVVASKVNLLGQQLRGAQYDFSDLRGNVERLLRDLEDAVLVFGRDRRLVVAAGALERFLGSDRSELIGKQLVDIFPPTTPLGLLLQQAAQTGRSIRDRRVSLTTSANGSSSVPVALLSVDVLEGLQAGAGGAMGGILVRLRDPEATRQIGRQLQTADRLSAISRITGGVAHEVKNPLNAILMHVELARMKLAKGDSDLGQQMDIIASEIVRLDRVVKTFLDFTKPVELHPSDIMLEAFVIEVAELARPLAQTAKIEVTVEQHAEGISIAADRDLLKQAVLNLVINAIEAMPHGGQLRFESSVRGEDAEIRVSDTGCGIPHEAKNKIFGLYFTTKEKGTGIGLAMTFRFVQLHDGTIDFTSEPGKGATFIIRIPMAVSSN
jgi:signal transduction histidine kinase